MAFFTLLQEKTFNGKVLMHEHRLYNEKPFIMVIILRLLHKISITRMFSDTFINRNRKMD